MSEYENNLTPQMKKNQESETAFRHWLYETVRKKRSFPMEEVMHSGAEKCECSQQSIKRYLQKATSMEGWYQIVDGMVKFKREYENHIIRERKETPPVVRNRNGQFTKAEIEEQNAGLRNLAAAVTSEKTYSTGKLEPNASSIFDERKRKMGL